MDYLMNALEKKEKELGKLKKECENIVDKTPSGAVQVFQKNGRYQYYHYYKKGMQNYRKYINKQNRSLAYDLARGDYLKKVIECVDEQLKVIQISKEQLQKSDVNSVYDNLNEHRKHLVKPIRLTDEEYIRNWIDNVGSQMNPFPIESELYSKNGEHVRSKSEKIIADELNMMGVPYRYEAALQLKDGMVVYPDFTILNIKTRQTWYMEHLGMLDDEDYLQHTFQKIDRYIQNGIIPGKNLIITYEKSNAPLNTKNLEIMLREHVL